MENRERWNTLAAEFLRRLARRDMAIWAARRDGREACEDDTPFPHETAKMIREMKRVQRLNRMPVGTGYCPAGES
jgi:hypothetical protein